MKLEVGQKLWHVPSGRHGDPYEVTVEKVGRKWAEIGPRLRISVETLIRQERRHESADHI